MERVKNKRIIAHLDMDAFFASVEEATTPRFKGKPIVVGAEPQKGRGRGVVSTANYKAREYGIRSAMPIFKAWQLSQKAVSEGKEEVIFLPPDFELYEKASKNAREIIISYAKVIEQASIDEFYFDLTFCKSFSNASKLCQKIKDEIKEKIKITCSAGIGQNKLIAKIAAGINKPDGLFLVPPNKTQKFLDDLEISEIPGIGPKTKEFFNKMGIVKVFQLRKLSKEELFKLAGKNGVGIYLKSRGIDESPVNEDRETKSVGEQSTLPKNTSNASDILLLLKKLLESVILRCKSAGIVSARTIAITVRFYDFETKTSAKTFKIAVPTDNFKRMEMELLKLMLPFLDKRSNPKRKPIRLVGVRLEKLSIKLK